MQKKKAAFNLKANETKKANKITKKTIMYVKRRYYRYFFDFDSSMSNVSRNKNEQRRKLKLLSQSRSIKILLHEI